MTNETFWQTKLHARLHDPAEKALVLLRDPEGHEGGTSRALQRDLGFQELSVKDWLEPDNAKVLDGVLFKKGIPVSMYQQVKRADHWAAAADRPQWPMEEIMVTTRTGQEKTRKVADWAKVHWTKRPILIHPLTGREIDLRSLGTTEIADIKQRSLDHFSGLIIRCGDAVEWRKTLMSFWRFGPELREGNAELGLLWPLLPADTRIPDHSIWDHLDLTSAFAGAFAADTNREVAVLAISLGPVQSFIAAARTTSDLWAGSHLLSRLSWEAMKVVCEQLGPDAILFPRLRGVPQVDVWLREEIGLPPEWFQHCDWSKKNTDANPLFAAALPNRFVALVPFDKAKEIAESVSQKVRAWLAGLGDDVVDRLLEVAGFKATDQARDKSVPAYLQMQKQLEGFPEVYWSVVPFPAVSPQNMSRRIEPDTGRLMSAMAPFFGAEPNEPSGFLATDAWQVLRKQACLEGGAVFFEPNPGVLYPAVYDLAERVLAAAKSVRPFAQSEQQGWRCSMTGETEWLTADTTQLKRSYRKQTETLWCRVAQKKPGWAKKGEHLGALPAIKRLWPTLFAEEVGRILGGKIADRFVVSTHTMALAENLVSLNEKLSRAGTDSPLENLIKEEDRTPALPRSLASLRGSIASRVPAAMDRLKESEEPDAGKCLSRLETEIQRILGFRPEAYYALLLMDGDNMGRILSGDSDYAISYRESFHPQVRVGFDLKAKACPSVADYGKQSRALSPNRHLAVSAALNDFALHVVPEVVEIEHRGKVIYCGGDDVFSMLPVSDLLSAMTRLRQTYSGLSSEGEQIEWRDLRRSKKLVCKDGFAFLRGKLMRMMGEPATASCGAVIAHHQAPLGVVLRELRDAEKRAKSVPGKDAFSLVIIKRSGGALTMTGKWGKSLELLGRFRDFLADPAVSRRAVYNSMIWIVDLPRSLDEDMLGTMLGYQFSRQTSSRSVVEDCDLADMCRSLAHFAAREKDWRKWIGNFLSVAEFIARECRGERSEPKQTEPVTSGAQQV